MEGERVVKGGVKKKGGAVRSAVQPSLKRDWNGLQIHYIERCAGAACGGYALTFALSFTLTAALRSAHAELLQRLEGAYLPRF
jgi:hypothetical protein